jgi:putative phosphoesterase
VFDESAAGLANEKARGPARKRNKKEVMKVLVLSDVHGNWPALESVLRAEPDADRIICLGDLVNYGPQPAECVAWAMRLNPQDRVVLGNHDLAFGMETDPGCSAAYQVMAEAMKVASASLLSDEMRRFLIGLQPLQKFRWEGTNCVACHAIPTDPLYGYLMEQAGVTIWESELVKAERPDILFLGHTHIPMITQFQRTLVINPGSVGQPRDGDPQAAYVIWQDTAVSLCRVQYDVEQTVRRFEKLNLEPHIETRLAEELRTGGRLSAATAA